MTSTSRAPFFSTIPIWMSPKDENLSVSQWISELLNLQKVLRGFSPMGGVANVWRPTSWAGPRPSRKSLNCASEESLTPGKMRLKQRDKGWCFQKLRSSASAHSCALSLLSLRAVAVHAAVCGLPAGLASHPAAHLHRQPRLRAPLDRAA